MRVDLRTVKDNPQRDFIVDPINDEVVAKLRQSIRDHTFWSGLVARKRKGGAIELAAGHHRLRAALAEGITHADISVLDADTSDLAMIVIMATENTLQRGNSATAITGTVASAARFIVRGMLTGDQGLSEIFESLHAREQAERALNSERGLGQGPIVRLLNGVPGINDGSVQAQLANLKASGDYARILGEVKDEIEAENAAALAQAEEEERQRRAWEEEQKRIEAEREERRRIAEEKRQQAEADRKARIEAAEQRKREAEEARKKAAAEAKAAREEADRQRAEAEAERQKVEAERERERIAEEREQAKVEKERQRLLKIEQDKIDAAQKELAEKRRKELAEEAKKFEALRKTKETAEKAAAKAAERKKTFDFEGVARVLENEHQVRVFREVVTAENVASHLPVEGQAKLAAGLVKLAKDRNHELSGAFIRENVISMVLFVKSQERELDKDDQRRLELADINAKMDRLMDDFSRQVRGMNAAGMAINELVKKHPKHPWRLTGEFRNALRTAMTVVATLNERIR